jgi:hypothetical protein
MSTVSRFPVNISANIYNKFIMDLPDSCQDKTKCKIVEFTFYANSMVTCTAMIEGALYFYLPLFAFEEIGVTRNYAAFVELSEDKEKLYNYFCPINLPDEQATFFSLIKEAYFFDNSRNPEGLGKILFSAEFPDSNILIHIIRNSEGRFIVRKNSRILLTEGSLPLHLKKQRMDWRNPFVKG